jgi:hypothetical protein
MSETARTDFLIRGKKENSEGDVFQGFRIAFPCFILWEQLGTDMLKQHATSVASCMVILAHIRRNRRLFLPFLLPAYLSH